MSKLAYTALLGKTVELLHYGLRHGTQTRSSNCGDLISRRALEAARAAFGLIRYADDGFGLPAGDGAACPPPSHGARRHELWRRLTIDYIIGRVMLLKP